MVLQNQKSHDLKSIFFFIETLLSSQTIRGRSWHIARKRKFMVKHYDLLYFCQYLDTYMHLGKIICLYVWVTSTTSTKITNNQVLQPGCEQGRVGCKKENIANNYFSDKF